MVEPRASHPELSVLIVGAGCVGQVFGHHLAKGGARVTLLVKPEHRPEAEYGFRLYPLRLGRGVPASQTFTAHAVLTRPEQVAGQRFDQVWLTVASHALGGDWLARLLACVGDASVVSLQPDPDDHVRIERVWGRSAGLLCGGIGLIAFHAPLPGQRGVSAEGTAYWFPPFVKSVFSGPEGPCRSVLTALRRGGLPAAQLGDVPRAMAFPNAIGMTYLTALEVTGFSVEALRRSPLLAGTEQAVREAIAIVRAKLGFAPWGIRLLAHAGFVAFSLRMAARFTPFPLLPYLARHFTKVAPQTHLIVERLIAQGDGLGLSTSALKRLNEARREAACQLR